MLKNRSTILRVAVIASSLALVSGFVLYRSGNTGLPWGAPESAPFTQSEAKSETKVIASDQELFHGSKFAPIITPPAESDPEMFSGSKSGIIIQPQDATSLIPASQPDEAPLDPFRAPS